MTMLESVDHDMMLLPAAVKQAVIVSFSRQPSCGQLRKMQSHCQTWHSCPYVAKVKQRRYACNEDTRSSFFESCGAFVKDVGPSHCVFPCSLELLFK